MYGESSIARVYATQSKFQTEVIKKEKATPCSDMQKTESTISKTVK